MSKLIALAIFVIAISCYAESYHVIQRGWCKEGAKYYNNCGWCQCVNGIPWCPVNCKREVGPPLDFWKPWAWNPTWTVYPWSDYRLGYYYPTGVYGWIPKTLWSNKVVGEVPEVLHKKDSVLKGGHVW